MKNNELTEVNDPTTAIIEPFISKFTELSIEHLIAQRDGLVAENAALKDSANFYRMGFKPIKGAFGIEYKPTEALLDDCGNNAMDALKTPATDAAIAEIKAQGVDEFARTFNSETIEGSSMVMVAKTFAANLRAGRKG